MNRKSIAAIAVMLVLALLLLAGLSLTREQIVRQRMELPVMVTVTPDPFQAPDEHTEGRASLRTEARPC